MRQLTYTDAEPSDLPDTGDLLAVGLRPKPEVYVRETYCLTCSKAGWAGRILGRWDPDRDRDRDPLRARSSRHDVRLRRLATEGAR